MIIHAFMSFSEHAEREKKKKKIKNFQKTIDNTKKVCYNYYRKKGKGITKMTIQRRTREEMLTEVIRMFGFEDERTIDFAAKCEEWEANNFNDDRLEGIIAKHKTMMWWDE